MGITLTSVAESRLRIRILNLWISCECYVSVEGRTRVRAMPDAAVSARPETAAMGEPESRDCTLLLAAQGRREPCLRERCAFWEPGGAVVGGACVLERLGLDVRSGLASYLLEVRERLAEF
jgi:hypothetical protein